MEIHISPLEWTVYKHYEVVEGMVHGLGSITNARKYYPFEQIELPNALAKIDPDNEQQVLEFIHRYGTLGGSPEDHGSPPEEPLTWLKQHITTVGLLLKLVECSVNNDEEAAELLYSEEEWKNGKTVAGIPMETLLSRVEHGDIEPGLTLNTPLGRVRRMALLIINSNIRGIRRQGIMLPDGGVKSAFYFSSMLDVIYWHILNAMEGADIARCQQCGTPFIKTDGRQKFCPKQYGEKESRCGMLYHQRERKHRKERGL